MEENSQKQKAGSNSLQLQIGKMEIGVTEERVRAIINEENQRIINESKIVASEIANDRLNKYADVFLPKLIKAEMLDAFSEPSVQMLYRKSEVTAMCTERKADYEMLSELLIHKIEMKDNFTISAAIEKAVSEVNNISIEALTCLTLLYALIRFTPTSGKISYGLAVLDSLYKKILNDFELPNTNDWLENLEVTNAIRLGTVGNSKKLEDYFFEQFFGYSVLGIKKDSEDYQKVLKIFYDNNLPFNLLVDNELNEEYVRLQLCTKDEIKHLFLVNEKGEKIDLSDRQLEAYENVFDMTLKNKEESKSYFIKFLYRYNEIKKVIEWWDKYIVQNSFTVTTIGKVLAHTNAKRIDYTIPDIK